LLNRNDVESKKRKKSVSRGLYLWDIFGAGALGRIANILLIYECPFLALL
jgi:hypothetical protein